MTQEAAIHRAYLANGIPAPKPIAVIDDPCSLVLERLPGTINTETIPDPAIRRRVREEFIAIIARQHQIPLEEFAEVGLDIPVGADAVSRNLYEASEAIFDRLIGRPWPLMRFVGGWMKRHVPQDRTRAAFINLMLDVVIPRSYDSDGGLLLSLFSGHGARDRDLRALDEADGYTEFQVPYDYRKNGYWSDSELAALYGMVNPSWRVRLWNDCCHAGDSLRAFNAWIGLRSSKALPSFLKSNRSLTNTFDYLAEPRQILNKADVLVYRRQLFLARETKGRAQAARALWAIYQRDYFVRIFEHENLVAAQGCQASQYSMDALIEQRPQGAFSAALWKAWNQSKPGASWLDVHQVAVQWLKSNGFAEQDPSLETQAPFLLLEPFLT
jgi:hypothetical protein